MTDGFQRAETSDLGVGVTSLSDDEFNILLGDLMHAVEEYDASYKDLTAYFDKGGEIENALDGDILSSFRKRYGVEPGGTEPMQPKLQAVTDHVNDLFDRIRKGANTGLDMADDLAEKVAAGN